MARCTYHPNTETELACAACGRPVCPREMVDTPVGYKCPECARLPKTALVRMRPRQVAGAVIAAVAAGAGGGLLLGYAFGVSPLGGFFSWVAAFVWGGLVAEAVRRGSGGHRGASTAAIAIAGVVAGAYLGGLGLLFGLIAVFAVASSYGLLSGR